VWSHRNLAAGLYVMEFNVIEWLKIVFELTLAKYMYWFLILLSAIVLVFSGMRLIRGRR